MNGLSTEILELIIKEIRGVHFISKHELSAAMVNRKWCRIIIPIMWDDPFTSTRFPERLIKIFLSILDEKSRLSLIDYGIDLSTSPPSRPTFDYAYFIRCLRLDKIYTGIKNHLFPDVVASINSQTEQLEEQHERQIGLVFQQICSLILRQGRIEHIRPDQPSNCNYLGFQEEINLIPYMTDARKCLEYLSTIFTTAGYYDDFHFGLSFICKNLTKIVSSIHTLKCAEACVTLIRVQNSLKWLSIYFSKDYLFVLILDSLSSQKDSLIGLSMKTCDFNIINDDTLESFMSCKKLERLELEYCIGLNKTKFVSLSRSFPLLKKFAFYYKDAVYKFPNKFIVGLIETASINLQELIFNVYSIEVVKAIIKYVPEYTKCRIVIKEDFKSYEELAKEIQDEPDYDSDSDDEEESSELGEDYEETW